MKIVKTLTLTAVLFVVLVTQASASWWNPVSWFNNRKVIQNKEVNVKQLDQTNLQNKQTSTSTKVVSTSSVLQVKKQESKIKTVSNSKAETVKINLEKEKAKATGSATNSHNKEFSLTVITTQGGNVFYPDGTILCHNLETCKKSFLENKKVTLKVAAMDGYSFKEWSDANCGKSKECSINIVEDTSLYARFEVTKPIERTGRITSISHPSDNCYVPLGRENCYVTLRWINNTGYDMLINIDGVEYYISTSDKNSFPYPSDADPVEVSKAEAEKSTGLTFLTLERGSHKISLVGGGKTLDTVDINVECMAGTSWSGTKCWKKDANQLFVFKHDRAVISSDLPGINCGYLPEKCLAGFSLNTKVTLKVTVEKGRSFVGWTGDCSGKELTCTVLMDKQKSVGVNVN